MTILTYAINAFRSRSGRGYEQELVARIKQIDWLANCGEPLNDALSLRIRRIETKSEAEALSIGEEWGDMELEFQNQLTLHLHQHARSEYRLWNTIVERAKREVIFPLERETWRPLLEKRRLNAKIVASLQWDILGALMESAYRDIPQRPTFFLSLLEVYESGRLPCGWVGDCVTGEGEVLVW